MKCQDCREYIGNICQKAQDGKISEIDNVICLLKCQISLLRAIWEQLVFTNNEKGEGEEWKL